MGSLSVNRAIFLDRDGVINKNIFYEHSGEWEAPLTPDHFELADGAIEALRQLQSAGLLLFVVSNQPNAAKAKATLETLDEIHQRLIAALDEAHIHFTAFYYCYHHPAGTVPSLSGPCDCRKPSPHFLLKAANDHNIDLAKSWIVGDRDTDVACGHAAGVHTIRIIDEKGNGSETADHNVADISAAAKIILHNSANE